MLYFLTDLGLELGRDIGEMLDMPLPMLYHYDAFFKMKRDKQIAEQKAAKNANN